MNAQQMQWHREQYQRDLKALQLAARYGYESIHKQYIDGRISSSVMTCYSYLWHNESRLFGSRPIHWSLLCNDDQSLILDYWNQTGSNFAIGAGF